MKTKTVFLLTLFLVLPSSSLADEVWNFGHHEILGGDVYGEIYMYSDATATMYGGDVYKVETYEGSAFDFLGGEMDLLYVHDNSKLAIRGGDLFGLGATQDAEIKLYAYDVVHHPTGGHFDRGWLEGWYNTDDAYFRYELNHTGTIDHITIIPEPTALIFILTGGCLARRWMSVKSNGHIG